MTDLLDALETRATRGAPRGADEVFARAVSVPEPTSDRPRRVAAVLAVAVVVVLVAAAVLAVRHTEPTDQGPVDNGLGVTDGERIVGPVFGAETDTTLLVASYTGSLVALDLDTGAARTVAGVNVGPTGLVRVRDQLVYLDEDRVHLGAVPLDLSAAPSPMPDLVNGRPVAANDDVNIVASGDTDRFWVESGPSAGPGDRPWLAEERMLPGGVVTPAIDLGRFGELEGATADLVAVGEPLRSEIRDRVTGEVEQTIAGRVIASGASRMVWQAPCGEPICPLHVLDVDAGEEWQVDVDVVGPGVLSPDGQWLAMSIETVSSGAELVVVDLDARESRVIPGARGLTGYAGEPTWSSDSRWVFAGKGDMEGGGLVGYQVTGDRAAVVTVEGLVPTSLLAVGRDEGPAFDQTVDDCPAPDGRDPQSIDGPVLAWSGEAQDNFPTDLTCLAVVTAGLGGRIEVPVDEGPTATTVPTDTVEAPMSPSDISVLVANGSGVEGQAGRVTDMLEDLGYDVFPPTNTTTDPADTPLDTVYYATVPNTQPQARQVAAALGMPESAVLPYNDADTVHADMSLAQVLVVLGSSPGMLATRADDDGTGIQVDVVPADGLSDRDTVTVSGTGYRNGQGVMVIQCALEEVGLPELCDPATNVAFTTPGGEVNDQFTVRRSLATSAGTIDCRATACAIYVGGVGSNTAAIPVPITFA